MSSKETSLASSRDPFALFRHMTADVDRMFDEGSRPFFRRAFRTLAGKTTTWAPEIDVFEKGNRLITKIDLPGMKKEDVKVEVTDGHLVISGERKSEIEEQKNDFYRCEREFGSFYRAVPLPEGAKIEDVVATFANGVLEVSVPLAVHETPKVRTVEIKEPGKTVKPAA